MDTLGNTGSLRGSLRGRFSRGRGFSGRSLPSSRSLLGGNRLDNSRHLLGLLLLLLRLLRRSGSSQPLETARDPPRPVGLLAVLALLIRGNCLARLALAFLVLCKCSLVFILLVDAGDDELGLLGAFLDFSFPLLGLGDGGGVEFVLAALASLDRELRIVSSNGSDVSL
jgi:hypothetical protein